MATFTAQSVHNGGLSTGALVMNDGSITDTSGAISFGNENLTTTGSSTAGSFVTGTLTVDDGSITDSDGSISFGDENLTTTGIISFGTLTDSGESIAVTKFVDEGDGIASNDNDTTVPTSAAVKDYVDTKVTAEDLDLTTDSGTIAIDLDSETLTLTGGTGVDTSATSNTVTFALDLNELGTESSIADADFIAMVDATDDGSGKITFENLEDAIFASVSGDIAIAEDGAATIQANSVALGTDTTGNYVATVADSGGGGITVANSGSESAAVTLELDIKGLTEDAIASGDYIAFSDEGESGDPANRETIDDVATLFAGTGLTASSAVIGVDASQTQITAVGTLATGAISSGFGAIDNGSSTANFGATTVDSLSVSDGNITNVADIALDSISADGTDINLAVSDNSATAFTIKQGSDAYLIVDTADSSESVSIGTGISGTVITLGHSTSETTVADNLSVTGNLTISGNLLITGDSSEVKADNLVVDNATIAMGLTNGAAPGADSGFDLGIVPHWHTGSGAKTAFLGVDVSTSASAPKLTYIPDASFSSSVVSGTAGTIVANLEGTITGASGSTVGNLTLADGSITDSSGAISFGNENLTTTGTFSAEHLTSTDDATIADTISIDGTMTIATGSITDSSGAIDFGNENLSTSGTLGAGVVTATGFTIGSAVIAEAELEMIDGITAGTAAASKAVVLDGSKNIATLGTIGSGAITATGSSSFATSIKTPLIEYTDGDDAITIADGGGITAANGITSTAAANSFGATAFSGAVTTNSTIDGIDIATRDGVLTSTTTTANAALPKAGGTMTGNIVMGDDTSIGIGDSAERIEFDGAGDISVLGANLGVGTTSPGSTFGSFAGGGTDGILEIAGVSSHGILGISKTTTSDNDDVGVIAFCNTGNSNGGAGTRPAIAGIAAFTETDDSNAGADSGGHLTFWTKAGGTDSVQTEWTEKMRIDDTGKVGIGTDSPNALLHLDSTVGAAVGIEIEHDGAQEAFVNLKNTTGTWKIKSDDSLDAFQIDNVGTATVLTILASGNVGIGATSVSSRAATMDDVGPVLELYNVGQDSALQLTSDSGGRGLDLWNDHSGANVYFDSRYDSNNTSGGNIYFRTRTSDDQLTAMTINQAAYVGIGNASTSPSNVLTVQDSGASGLVKIYSTTGAITNGQAVLEVRADDTSSPSSYNLIEANVSGTTKFKVDGDGTTTITATTLTLSGQGASGLNIGNEESGSKRITLNGAGSNDSAIEFRTNAVSRTDLGCFGGGTDFQIKMYDSGWQSRFSITAGGTFTGSSSANISDRDLKKNINLISNGLETINKLQGRTFEWKKSTKMDGGIKYGLIAQELEEVLPDLVWEKSGLSKKEDGSYHKSIHMTGVIPVLIEAVKELSQQNDDLKKRIEALEA